MKKSLNDLLDYDLKIYQYENSFKFSLDSVLLAEFVRIRKENSLVMDFCTGNGAIPLILSTKYSNSQYIGIEIQKNIFELAIQSVNYNHLSSKIEILNDDVKNVRNLYKAESFDVITCNPPYFKVSNKKSENKDESKCVARHEISITLDEIIMNSSYLLKNKGDLYLVHRTERLQEILTVLNKYKMSVKDVQFVYSDIDKNAIIILIRAVKNGKLGLRVLKPLNVFNIRTYKNKVGE